MGTDVLTFSSPYGGVAMARITLDDGREFPTLDGTTPLGWDPGSYLTWGEAAKGYPKIKAILQELRYEALQRERNSALRGSFDRMLGRASKTMLELVEAEISRRG